MNIQTRREILRKSGTGLGILGLAGVLQDEGLKAKALAEGSNPLAPKPTHFAGKAKRMIHIYLNGGPSQMDTFDHKPLLKKYAGKTIPTGNLRTERPTGGVLPSPFKFHRYGKSGMEISEIFDKTASSHADDLCIIRSMQCDTPNHEQSMRLMNCGDQRLSRPSLGSWLMYGMGSENRNLPGFVALCPGLPVSDVSNWRSAFLPGICQGTYVDTRKKKVNELLPNLKNDMVSGESQAKQLELFRKLNERHLAEHEDDPDLEARIKSFELAFRMQTSATDAFDIDKEPLHVRERYGKSPQARQLLMARRLLERGVRYVQCYHGNVQPWDSHSNIHLEHRQLGLECDQGIAALLTDLKERGLFEDTLVLCGGEFGRTPAVELPQPGTGNVELGRDHNHYGFSLWLAGGGVKGGMTYGSTDDFGYRAIENPVHVHDLHATILHLMGFDHEQLTYRFSGRDFRLTDVYGKVVRGIMA